MIDHSNFTHNLRGRSTKDSYTQWPISERDWAWSGHGLWMYTSVSMRMFILAAIWGIGQTPCSFEHYHVVRKSTQLILIHIYTKLPNYVILSKHWLSYGTWTKTTPRFVTCKFDACVIDCRKNCIGYQLKITDFTVMSINLADELVNKQFVILLIFDL